MDYISTERADPERKLFFSSTLKHRFPLKRILSPSSADFTARRLDKKSTSAHQNDVRTGTHDILCPGGVVGLVLSGTPSSLSHMELLSFFKLCGVQCSLWCRIHSHLPLGLLWVFPMSRSVTMGANTREWSTHVKNIMLEGHWTLEKTRQLFNWKSSLQCGEL